MTRLLFSAWAAISIIAAMSRLALGAVQWVLDALLPGMNLTTQPPSSAEVKNVWNYTSAPPYIFMVWY
jgi:hypothetical protein